VRFFACSPLALAVQHFLTMGGVAFNKNLLIGSALSLLWRVNI